MDGVDGVEVPGVLDMGRSQLAGDLLQAPQHIAGVKGPGDAADVNMAGPGVEPGQVAEGNQVHPPVSPGSRPPLEVEPAPARDFGT